MKGGTAVTDPPRAPLRMSDVSFDVGTYAATVRPVDWADLDLDGFRTRPLSDGTLRCLRYMSDVETHTVCYLRDLLITPSHRDPAITTFLSGWNWEEYWHGEILDKVLQIHGVPTGPEHTQALRKDLGWSDRWAPLVQSIAANLVGEDFIATHMTWGAVNEWCTHSGYSRLVAVERHPLLTEILRRIAKQETRHIAFYNSQARDRLTDRPKAQRITRLALRARWGIVGSGVMPHDEIKHLLTYLYGDQDGLVEARTIDTKIDTLPGLAGLQLVERQLRRFGITQ
ncbi:ferritin-like domain-containing protein [Kribbella sp. NPDC003505]|uniref:ferritin-like domain-containing protein n=1 Tax=Kribbella sp. NPDC003505 TaxID=3154448 RepID=UPI0033AEF369